MLSVANEVQAALPSCFDDPVGQYKGPHALLLVAPFLFDVIRFAKLTNSKNPKKNWKWVGGSRSHSDKKNWKIVQKQSFTSVQFAPACRCTWRHKANVRALEL